MKEGDTASYGHVALHDYENSLRVVFEVLEHREFENRHGNNVEQWHVKVRGYDRDQDEDVVVEEVVISIMEKDPENIWDYQLHESEFETMIWVADEDPSQSIISVVHGEEQPEYPWATNHDQMVVQYSRYNRRETITSAVLTLLEEIHLVF